MSEVMTSGEEKLLLLFEMGGSRLGPAGKRGTTKPEEKERRRVRTTNRDMIRSFFFFLPFTLTPLEENMLLDYSVLFV